MADTLITTMRRGPLDGIDAGLASDGNVALRPTGFRTLVNLRARADDKAFAAGLSDLFGLELPGEPNRYTGDGEHALLWLGPDEWLLLAPDNEAPGIADGLRAALGDDPWLAVVDLSHNYTGLTLSGPSSRDVLAKGCPLDMHPRTFGKGQCAQSILAGTRVLLRATARDTFELWVRNSFARYTVQWLTDAMAEYDDG
ncbi:MAG: sarcosine oxidase subunit gamma family protein [Woeseiaceae bacterium]|nr:sarcosine oxidase subunit gamma family protein [Woeseiaceae bacterium]